MDTRRRRIIITFLLSVILLSFSWNPISLCEEFNHIEKLFDLRTSIGEQGKLLPEKIKTRTGNDLSTLERIFELNTSALTTIEAYFQILKIAMSTETESNSETVSILNEWLAFINNQCGYDIEYLEEALKESMDNEVIEQINTAKENIKRLSQIVSEGINENNMMAGNTD
ncbi:MAG: hypothetical protein DRP85_07865 [Candidatus Makaraimicrobium thalassicum]|nr:MAG: hypothetical protein DRP85_07865 [Candidatus Omnitrophota bacterium]